MKISLVLWLAIIIPQNAFGADLQEVLDKHLESLGGREALAAIRSAEAYSSVSYMGLTGTAVSIIEPPMKYYTRIDLGVLSEVKGFDGLTAWTTDFNGVTRQDIVEELKPMLNELYLSTYSYLLSGRNPGRIEYRGDTLNEGGTYHQLALFPEGGDSLFVLINAATGRLEYRVESVTGITMITAYRDFRNISGVEVPFFTEVETPGAPYEISAWIDSVRINTAVPDSIFLMPGASSVDYRFPAESDSVAVKIDMKRNGLFIEVRINGRGPFLFLLDSGAASTILSKALAEDLGMTVDGAIPARGVGGFGSMGFGLIDSVNIETLSWHLKRITVFDFEDLTGTGLAEIDGILGYDFFARFPMLIDFGRKKLILYDPARADLPSFDNSLDIEIYCQVPVVEVVLDGHPVRLALDLGAQMGLMIQGHSRWYRAVAETLDDLSEESKIQGVGGAQSVKTARADSLQIGNIKIDRPTVLIAENYAAIPFPDYIEGFLGVEILKRFQLFIDYSHRKIYLDNKAAPDK